MSTLLSKYNHRQLAIMLQQPLPHINNTKTYTAATAIATSLSLFLLVKHNGSSGWLHTLFLAALITVRTGLTTTFSCR
jgi:hypothetical protein